MGETKFKQILALILLALAIAQAIWGSPPVALYWAIVAAYWSLNC